MAEGARDAEIPKSPGHDSTRVGNAVHLERIYYGNSAGAFRGPQALLKEAKAQGLKGITLRECREFLATQATYTKFRPARRRYPRNRVIAHFCGEVVQIDLMDMQHSRSENDGYLYAFLSYDTFSKYLIAFPIKNRKPPSIISGLEHLVSEAPFPISRIYWDREGSFGAKVTREWLKTHDILSYSTTSSVKAPGVERVIRTIRLALARFFDHTGTVRWIDFLPQIVSNYNDRPHSSTKKKPLDIVADPMTIVPTPSQQRKSTKLPPIGSFVRLNRNRGVFGKESSGAWTEEIFRVSAHQTSTPIPMISVTDLTGAPIEGSVYPGEYQPVKWRDNKDIAQIFARRRRNGKSELLVTFVGWPSTYRQWISEDTDSPRKM